jgi:serine/threonine protein kinase
MGVVYLAWDSNLHRSVALKVMKRAIAENESSRQRFLLEARATAAIDHDHIVTIYQVGDHNGIPYLVMKYLEGQTLEDLLRKRKVLEPLEAVKIARPANIWLESVRNRVKILDFGLARIADSTDPNITQTGVILGTPAYMSPEQAAGLALDGRSDLFSLGTVLYRLTVGKPPFRGSNNLAILRSLSLDNPESPAHINPAIPPRLSKLILRLLEKEPGSRPGSASLVANMLESIEQDLASMPSDGSRYSEDQSGSSQNWNLGSGGLINQPAIYQQSVMPGPSNLVGVNLDEIVLAPLEDDQNSPEKKPTKPVVSKLAEQDQHTEEKVKKSRKAEVSPLLRKLAEQAALQDEAEEAAPVIYDSRSATLDAWKRQNYWANFPWRPIAFTFGFIIGVTLLVILCYSLWQSDMVQSRLGG